MDSVRSRTPDDFPWSNMFWQHRVSRTNRCSKELVKKRQLMKFLLSSYTYEKTRSKNEMVIERMKIYLAGLEDKEDSFVQSGTRPIIVLQNNAGNRSSPTVIVAPITSKLEKPHLPTHVVLRQSNLPKRSMVLLEQVMTIDQKLLIKEYGEIGEQDTKSVERALKVSFGLLHSKKKRRRK